ncbi:MAG: M1 family metallopeptidase [Ginsengibacter sp.]
MATRWQKVNNIACGKYFSMKVYKIIFLKLLLVSSGPLFSQGLFTTTQVRAAYTTNTRSASGKPGRNYWQNKGDYTIRVTFAPSSNLLTGIEMISYYNNSPDTLDELVIRLYPDLYKKDIVRLSTIADKDLDSGVTIDSLQIGNESITNFTDSIRAFYKGTNLIIKPGIPVLPHSQIQLSIGWHYLVNTASPVRTGMVDAGSYFIAYFFPRISVYDDIDGWDEWSYNGQQEFYNDFGNFKVDIFVPKNYVVWATGDRVNPGETFSGTVIKKMEAAALSAGIIHIIDSSDYRANNVFAPGTTGAWKFNATNVTDFAFAVSDHYLWDASSVLVDSVSGRKTLAEAAYNKIHNDYFDVASQAHQVVFYASHYFPKVPFPFNHITVFDGTDQMEYPMMVNDNPLESRKDAVQLTSHEIFHSYFPFYMGINETQYAWMDEGWASIGESVISPLMGEPEDDGIFSKSRYEETSGTDKDVPLITNTKLYNDAAYFSNSYGKGGICYYVLQDLLGDVLFFKALHQYMDDWHGRHPVPNDFFYSINNGSGRNLDWFWDKWFFGWSYPDLAIKQVAGTVGGTKITIENTGGLPLPVFLTIQLPGKKDTVRFTAAAWKDGKKTMNISTKISLKDILKITLGNEFIPDKFKGDNEWIPK